MTQKKRALILSGGGARGAFQVGVCKHLRQIGFLPDLVCGTSVGAMNAVALASGMSMEKIEGIWMRYSRKDFFRLDFFRFITSLFSTKKYHPIVNTLPLESLIREQFDFEALKNSPTDVVITAVDTKKGRIVYYGNKAIDLDILMASTAMPLMCSWRDMSGQCCWDGGIMDNVPLLPALEANAREIVVVLLSPVGILPQDTPCSIIRAAELVFEQSLIGSMVTLLAQRSGALANSLQEYNHGPDLRQGLTLGDNTRIRFVYPERMLGFASLVSFSQRRSRQMMRYGFDCARRQLAGAL